MGQELAGDRAAWRADVTLPRHGLGLDCACHSVERMRNTETRRPALRSAGQEPRAVREGPLRVPRAPRPTLLLRRMHGGARLSARRRLSDIREVDKEVRSRPADHRNSPRKMSSRMNSRYRKCVSSRHEPIPSGTARAGEAGGLLIHAAVGSGGGTGTPRGKRSGCAWRRRAGPRRAAGVVLQQKQEAPGVRVARIGRHRHQGDRHEKAGSYAEGIEAKAYTSAQHGRDQAREAAAARVAHARVFHAEEEQGAGKLRPGRRSVPHSKGQRMISAIYARKSGRPQLEGYVAGATEDP